MRLSLVQRIVLRLMPGSAEAIERESRQWIATCPKCGRERSIWELGGVRYKAWSRGLKMGFRCDSCGRFSMHRVERRRSSQPAPPTAR